jgi:aminoglycoside/choline kinase family phosphotransferase
LAAPPNPNSCETLTPAWLTAALGGSEALGGASVTSFDAQRIGEGVGFMAIVNRLSLTYDRPAPDAPRTVVCKFPSPDPGARQIAATFRHYEKEVRFYEQMAADSPIRAPRAYHQSLDLENGDFFLLMEDLSHLKNGDQLGGLSLAEARVAISALARLQARWWETPELHAMDWLPPFEDPGMLVLQDVFQQCWEPYCGFMGERLPPAMRGVGAALGTRIRAMLRGLSQSPVTLVHGDYRADNLFFGDDASLAVVDWQIVLRGRGAFDLAYFLTGNLTVEDREANETELVQLFHATLCQGGVSGYSLEELWRDYRLCTLFGWIWPVVAIGSLDTANERGVAFFFEWSRRVCTAIEDLDAAAVLAEY